MLKLGDLIQIRKKIAFIPCNYQFKIRSLDVKQLILSFLFLLSLYGLGQSVNADSLKWANIELDKRIEKLIHKWDSSGYDFVVLRTTDSLWLPENKVRFLLRQDTCTRRYGLNIGYDYSIGYVSISYIDDYYDPNNPICHDEVGELEELLGFNEIDLLLNRPVLLNFSSKAYVVYGVINGKYFYESTDKPLTSEFHSGIVYDLVCRYLHGCG